MKAVKIVIKVVVCLVVLLLAALLALPLWFGPVAKTVANSVVPGIVKTDFKVGLLSLNPYTGKFELGDMILSNPKGYSAADAVKVGQVVFDAETMSLMTDVIHIEELSVRDLFVSVVSGGENRVLNFTQIQYNVAGGKEKYEAAQSDKKVKSASSGDNPAPEAGTPAAEKPAKKIIIDRLEVSGLTLQLSILPIRIPTVVLKDIGRKSGGATLEEAWQQILDGIFKVAGVTSDQLKALGILSGDAVKKTNEAVSKVTARASAVMGGATKKLSATTEKATSVVSSTVGTATDIATGSMGQGAKVVGEGAKAAGDGVKAVGDGAKAAGDGVKKTLDSLKSLW